MAQNVVVYRNDTKEVVAMGFLDPSGFAAEEFTTVNVADDFPCPDEYLNILKYDETAGEIVIDEDAQTAVAAAEEREALIQAEIKRLATQSLIDQEIIEA